MFFYGNFAFMSPPSLLQVLCQERRSVHLYAWRGASEARLQLVEGRIISAYCDGLDGAEAVYQLVAWDCGQFRLEPIDAISSMGSFVADWEQLVLEAARRRDEMELLAPALPRGPSRQQLVALLVACPALAGLAVVGYDGRLLVKVGIADSLTPHITTLAASLGAISTALSSTSGVALYANGGQKFLLADCGAQTRVLAVPAATARIGDAIGQLSAKVPQLTQQIALEMSAGAVSARG